MVYSRGGIPIGDYNPDRIVNLGDGHASWDNGFGYTYFNATTGFEFSAVSGLTYNFTNPHTDYQNGIDWHVDLEASRFLTKQFYVGAVGYSFNQLTGDTGSGATLGPYISRISAVGPGREPVTVAKMFAYMVERRDRLQVQRRQNLYPRCTCQKCPVLTNA